MCRLPLGDEGGVGGEGGGGGGGGSVLLSFCCRPIAASCDHAYQMIVIICG